MCCEMADGRWQMAGGQGPDELTRAGSHVVRVDVWAGSGMNSSRKGRTLARHAYVREH